MQKTYPVPAKIAAASRYDAASYAATYRQSIHARDEYWAEASSQLDWMKPWDRLVEEDFQAATIGWFLGGKLNVAANCLDRHLADRGDKTAIIWQGDNPEESRHISYKELHQEVCKAANMLQSLGVQAGDRVTIYLPMIVEAAISMLACARIGATHSVVFGGFSPAGLRGRIEDAESKLVITADEGLRGGKKVPLKDNVDKAMAEMGAASPVKQVLVVKRTAGNIAWHAGRDSWWHEVMAAQSSTHQPQAFGAEHPLFILYTSGSTGKPKGIQHSSAGYLLYAMMTHRDVFDLREDDIYWCTADVGWVTGHSYIIYGPLANGATTMMFEGVPNYPDASRFWQEIDKHRVTLFYTAPTAIRALMREGDDWLQSSKRDSLRILGSVGEPINPEAWRWYYEQVGNSRCRIVDTWWQTETGGIILSPLPGATDLKPGCATKPYFGIEPVLMDEKRQPIMGEGEGALCIAKSWPGIARSVYGNHARFKEVYFSDYPNYYFSGDGARRDADGDYWIAGRMDDVLNVSGHRLGTAEIESALVAHHDVSEAAVVGMPHAIKGEAIYAYVTLYPHVAGDEACIKRLKDWVRKEIGAIATPEVIHIAESLPKTRSGKIMRRILRKIAKGDSQDFGDISTLLNPESVEQLVKGR